MTRFRPVHGRLTVLQGVTRTLVILLCGAAIWGATLALEKNSSVAQTDGAAPIAVSGVLQMEQFALPQGTAVAFRIIGANNKPVAILVRATKGFIVCSNFDLKALESREVAAASVSGLKQIDDVLTTNIVAVTKQAEVLGIHPGMPAKEALSKLM